MGEMKIQPPPWLHNCFIEIMDGQSQTQHLEDVVASPWSSTTLLDLLFALFSSMCEQKVSAYMPSWALLVMTAVW
jgi:hypothetical protein